MKKIRIFGAVIALFGLGSCGESFFDLTPNYEVAVDDIYETAGGLSNQHANMLSVAQWVIIIITTIGFVEME